MMIKKHTKYIKSLFDIFKRGKTGQHFKLWKYKNSLLRENYNFHFFNLFLWLFFKLKIFKEHLIFTSKLKTFQFISYAKSSTLISCLIMKFFRS